MRRAQSQQSLPWILLALLGAAAFCFALSGCLAAYSPTPDGPGSTSGASTGGGNSPADNPGAAGSSGSTSAAEHCVTTINKYRAQNGVPALQLDSRLSAFSSRASQALAAGGAPHQFFVDASNAGTLFSQGFCNGAAENQAPGWPVNGDENATIDAVLEAMMGEGPGGGHHDNIVGAGNAIVGVGLVVTNGQLYFTNDFSPACH